jgi:hypothetical protein
MLDQVMGDQTNFDTMLADRRIGTFWGGEIDVETSLNERIVWLDIHEQGIRPYGKDDRVECTNVRGLWQVPPRVLSGQKNLCCGTEDDQNFCHLRWPGQ